MCLYISAQLHFTSEMQLSCCNDMNAVKITHSKIAMTNSSFVTLSLALSLSLIPRCCLLLLLMRIRTMTMATWQLLFVVIIELQENSLTMLLSLPILQHIFPLHLPNSPLLCLYIPITFCHSISTINIPICIPLYLSVYLSV